MTLRTHPNITVKDERPKTPVQIDKCHKRCPAHKKECELGPNHAMKHAHMMPDNKTVCGWE